MQSQKSITLRNGLLIVLILAAAFSRLIPHPYNFTPIGAIGLFGAAHFTKRWQVWVTPFAAMWVSDLVLNNLVYARLYPEHYTHFEWFGDSWVYLSFGLIIVLGTVLLRKIAVSGVVVASLGASLLFYIITNFGTWLGSTTYSQDISGLIACYTAGIPFFGNTIAGDLFYSAVLFGVFELFRQRYPSLNGATTR